jgi:hypothetical protein
MIQQKKEEVEKMEQNRDKWSLDKKDRGSFETLAEKNTDLDYDSLQNSLSKLVSIWLLRGKFCNMENTSEYFSRSFSVETSFDAYKIIFNKMPELFWH